MTRGRHFLALAMAAWFGSGTLWLASASESSQNACEVLLSRDSDQTCLLERTGKVTEGTSLRPSEKSSDSSEASAETSDGSSDHSGSVAASSNGAQRSSDKSEDSTAPCSANTSESTDNCSGATSVPSEDSANNSSQNSSGSTENASDHTSPGNEGSSTDPSSEATGEASAKTGDSSDKISGDSCERTDETSVEPVSDSSSAGSKSATEGSSDSTEASSDGSQKSSGSTEGPGTDSGTQVSTNATNSTFCPEEAAAAARFKRSALVKAAAPEAASRLAGLLRATAGVSGLPAPGRPSPTLASALTVVDPEGRLSQAEATLRVVAEAEGVRLGLADL